MARMGKTHRETAQGRSSVVGISVSRFCWLTRAVPVRLWDSSWFRAGRCSRVVENRMRVGLCLTSFCSGDSVHKPRFPLLERPGKLSGHFASRAFV